MNYIKQLQAENERQSKKLVDIQRALNEYYAFLHSSKFTGSESDGSPKNWINTTDVINWIQDVKNQLVD